MVALGPTENKEAAPANKEAASANKKATPANQEGRPLRRSVSRAVPCSAKGRSLNRLCYHRAMEPNERWGFPLEHRHPPRLARLTQRVRSFAWILSPPRAMRSPGQRSILSSAGLPSADLLSADLLSADLLSADLLSADLLSADLLSADLLSAALLSADLVSADRSAAPSRTVWLFSDAQPALSHPGTERSGSQGSRKSGGSNSLLSLTH
jgi:hypothetical protein